MSTSLLISIFAVILLLIIGVPVPFCFMLTTAYLVFTLDYDASFLVPHGYASMSSMVLLCIPMFILVGGVMERSKIGESLIDFIELFVGRMKGSLGAVSVIACAVFGSVSGSIAATISCIGSIMYPRLKAQNYPDGYRSALISCAAPLGILIPPSSSMILYAWAGQQSVLACFLSTVVPGLILTFLLCLINYIVTKNNKNIKWDIMCDNVASKQNSRVIFDAIPAIFMPIIVLGGIYGGFMTPTEASAVAVIYSIPVGFFIYKSLSVKSFIELSIETSVTSAVCMIMMFCIMLLSRIYVLEGLPEAILKFLAGISNNKYFLILLINIFLIIMGMIMDDVSCLLLCTPILLPVMRQLGVHPVQFAAIIGVNVGIGVLSPPTAPTLYFGARMSGVPVAKTLKPLMIFMIFAYIPVLLAVSFIPEVALWLPRLVLGRI